MLSGAINWEMLKNQYFSSEVFRDELFNMIQSPEGVSDVLCPGEFHLQMIWFILFKYPEHQVGVLYCAAIDHSFQAGALPS